MVSFYHLTVTWMPNTIVCCFDDIYYLNHLNTQHVWYMDTCCKVVFDRSTHAFVKADLSAEICANAQSYNKSFFSMDFCDTMLKTVLKSDFVLTLTTPNPFLSSDCEWRPFCWTRRCRRSYCPDTMVRLGNSLAWEKNEMSGHKRRTSLSTWKNVE